MSTRKNSRYIKIAAFVALLSTALYAAITFNPDTQPLVAVGPYALKSDDLSTADNRAYRPWYENGAWQGDLIEYSVDTSGNRTTTADNYIIPIIDFTPVSDFEKWAFATYGEASLEGADQNWTARTTFAYKEWLDPYNDATDVPYWQQRNIFTWDGISTVPFEWDNLVDAGMAGDLDPATLDDPLLLDTNPWASPILNYVRGDHKNEKNQPHNGTLRSRYSLLGDIVNANPVYIGPPTEIYIDPAFITFKTDSVGGYADRPAIIAMGANDGMLHVFSAADGSELYAYIPSMLVHKLDRLAVVPPYQHTYYVDGRLTSASAKINGSWTTVLTGGLGAGEKGLFALDVTATDPSSHTVLFEKTSAEFGYIYGQPSLLRMPGGTWSIFTGNGLGTNDRAQLLVVNLDDESVTAINTLDDTPAGLSEATLIDTNNDQIVDLAFAGDTKGDMWRFAFDPDPAKDATVTKVYDGSADQPITTGPEVGEHPNGGYMVYWGTGNATSLTDAQDTSYPTQAIYGIWDQATGTRIAIQTLSEQIDATFPNAVTGNKTETVRYIAENEFETIQSSNKYFRYICPAADSDCIAIKGWKLELTANERLIGGMPQLRAARLTFVTSNPVGINTFDDGTLNPDLEGVSWLMSVDYLTGGDNGDIALNLNADNKLGEEDTIFMLEVDGKRFDLDVDPPPVGLQLGKGSISQPYIAKLNSSINMMFINGLELPLPQVEPGGPLFNGHIDVIVDSPLDVDNPLDIAGLNAPNNIAYMSQGYNIQTSDGLGKAVDGLVHEYSDMHGVSYVDLFELEPRRGLTSMDGTPFPPVNGECPGNSTEINDATDALYACVVTALDAELNRAYDTFTRVTDNNVDLNDNGTCPADGDSRYGPFYEPVLVDQTLAHCIEWRIEPKSETYLLGKDTSIPKDKPFIVTLANADLSTAGILQIGCRTWPVEVYQDMITSQLEAGIQPENLVDTVYGLNADSPLLFTLEGIASGDKDPDGIQCPDDSRLPTLRVSFEQRSILDLGIHGTRSQCVLGLHQPEDKVCYADTAVLAAAENIIPKIQDGSLVPDDDPTCGDVTDAWGPPPVEEVTVTDDAGNIIDTYYRTYLQDPEQNWHITWNPNVPGAEDLIGFRWRNGALTLQLIDAGSFDVMNSDCSATATRPNNCPLQDPDSLLKDKNGVRRGGTFAQAFTAEFQGKRLSGEIKCRETITDECPDPEAKAPNDSGLLYEAAMYWHYGRLADDIRTSAELGSGNPSSTPCYGDPNYSSRLQIEASGANPGEINRIIEKSITEDELRAYFDALAAVQNCGNDAVTCGEALVALATMLALDPDLALLDSILPYVDIDDLDLPPDIAGNVDSTPNRDVTSLDIDVGGKPQFIKSLRRSWIDLRY